MPLTLLVKEPTENRLADAPATIIGQRKIVPAGQMPIKFGIGFDPKAVLPGRTYALQARITVVDRLMFVTDTRLQIDPLDGKPQTVVLKMVAA